MATPELRRDTPPGADGWLDSAPGDLSGCGCLLLSVACGVVAIGFLLLRLLLVTR